MFWRLTETEEKVLAKVSESKQEILVKMSQDKFEVLAKVKELLGVVKAIEADRDKAIERIVARAVKAESREKKFSRQVRRHTDELDAAANPTRMFATRTSEAFYKVEESRVVDNLRRDAEKMEAVQGANRVLRSRRKGRPEPPRPLRLAGEQKDEQEVIKLD